MNVEIGAEAALFPEKELPLQCVQRTQLKLLLFFFLYHAVVGKGAVNKFGACPQ